jgi:anti-sigma regulatory factor (Ser/Thr protein kinase)
MRASVSKELEISTPATFPALLSCLEAIDHFGMAGNHDPGLIARVCVVVEELFSNTIKYGQDGESQRTVRVNLHAEAILTLIYEDDAPPFDPTLWRPAEGEDDPVRALREGEAGLALVFGLAAAVAYEALPDGNRLVATFAPKG